MEFLIPVEKCGTSVVDIDSEDGSAPKRGFENIVVFQNDPTYQEVWDHARMIVCRYAVTDDFDLKEKRIVFKPVVVDMLDVIRVSFTKQVVVDMLDLYSSIPIQDETGEQTRVDCWMEITRGRFPQNNAIDGPVKVGSPLTLAIFIRDPRKRTDVRVKDCYAYDDPEVAENNGPALLQLTDFDGCPTKPKLIEVWKRTLDTGPTGATVIAFSTVTAFKFPDRADLQLTCNIELCRTQCATRCGAELPDPVVIGPWNREIEDGDTAIAGAGPSTTSPTAGSPITPQTPIESEEEEDKEESEESENEPGEGESEATTASTTTEATPSSEAPPEGDDGDEEEEEEGSEEEATSPSSTTPSTTTAAEAGDDDAEEDGESANGGGTDSGTSGGETDSGEDTESETEGDNEAENESDDEESEESNSPATTPSTTTTTTTAATEATTSESADDDAAEDDEEEADEESNGDDAEESESSAKLKQTSTININTKTKSKAVTTFAPKTTKNSKSKTSSPTKQPVKASAAIVKSETRTNLIEQIHWSTTTLRPLKELMNQKTKSKSVNILTSKKSPLSRSTTTTAPPKLKSKKTTTTTTTPSTTTTTTTKAPTTTTKATTTTTTRATTTTKKSARRASAKKSSKAKTSTTTTERSSTQPAPRRARAPSSSHPDEFPNLHIVEDRKRFLATRRPQIFRFKSLSLIKSSTTVAPPVYENAEHLAPENLTRVTLTPAFFRQRMPARFQYRGRQAPNVTDQQTTTTTTTEPPKPDLSELRRPPLKNEDILDDRVSDNRPFYTFHFQPQRIRKPINRVVRSVTMTSNVIKTRLNSGIFVI